MQCLLIYSKSNIGVRLMLELKPHENCSEFIYHSDGLEEFQIVCVHWECNGCISLLMQDASQKGFWYGAVMQEKGVTFNGNPGVGIEQHCRNAQGKGKVYGFYSYEEFGKWASSILPKKK